MANRGERGEVAWSRGRCHLDGEFRIWNEGSVDEATRGFIGVGIRYCD